MTTKVLSLANDLFREGEKCFFKFEVDQEALSSDLEFNYLIDVDITTMYGVTTSLLNGTSLGDAGNLQVAKNGTFTYSAQDKVWVSFITEVGYEGMPTFLAQVSLHPVEKSLAEVQWLSQTDTASSTTDTLTFEQYQSQITEVTTSQDSSE